MDLKVTFSPPFLPPPSETIPYTVPSHPHIAFYLIKLQRLKFPRCKAHFPSTELFVWYLTKTYVHILYFSVCRLISFLTIGDPVMGSVMCEGLARLAGTRRSCSVPGSSVQSWLHWWQRTNINVSFVRWDDNCVGLKSLK